MDMSFAIQLLSAKYLVEHRGEVPVGVIDVPKEIDRQVADRKLKFWGTSIDTLTPEQEKYINSWNI